MTGVQTCALPIYFDLNGFKKLNDTKGHKDGDALLAWVGQAVRESLRDVDFGCRYGGDEFCLIMPRTSPKQAQVVYDRFLKAYDAGTSHDVTFSAGLAQLGPDEYPHPDTLIKSADEAMYKAKAKAKAKPGHYLEIAK